MNDKLWNEIVKLGKENQSHEEINVFDENDINTILGTMDFFDTSDVYMRQTFFDLYIAKFRFFDWLAMGIMGRNVDNRIVNNVALKVLVHSFRKSGYNEKKMIDDLRYTDYQMVTEWKLVDIEGME